MLQRDYAPKMNVFYVVIILFAYSLLPGLSGLRLMKVVIPAYKLRGESAFLECQYELNRPSNDSTSDASAVGGSFHRSRNHLHQRYHHQQQPAQTYRTYEEPKSRDHRNSFDSGEQPEDGEALYAVKWYKDNEEFYRYVPKANPPKQSYRVDGIRVVEEHSDSSRVLLRGLTLNSTGLYKCEVSAEAPNFSSVQGEGRMDIVYLPRDGPHIRGKEDQYQIGDTLNLNCTSGKSHPASHLQWFINKDAQVHSSSLIRYNDTVHKHGLITSTLGLQLIVDARHFDDGVMRVKCLASISPVLWKGGKESVLQRRQGVIDNREAMLLVVNSSSYPSRRLFLLVVSTLMLKLQQLVLSYIS